MVIRKHAIVYLSLLLSFLLVVILPVVIFTFFWSRSFPLSQGGFTAVIGYLFVVFYLLYGLLVLLVAWLNEEFDLFILTTHRLIDITQVNFLKRVVGATPLEQIQDTTGDIKGFFGTLLDYGSISVRTAASDSKDFSIDRVPEPTFLARKILNYADQSRETGGVVEAACELSDMDPSQA